MAMAARDGAITTARPQVICCYDNVNMIATVFFVAKIYNTYLPRRDQGGKGSHLNSLMKANCRMFSYKIIIPFLLQMEINRKCLIHFESLQFT